MSTPRRLSSPRITTPLLLCMYMCYLCTFTSVGSMTSNTGMQHWSTDATDGDHAHRGRPMKDTSTSCMITSDTIATHLLHCSTGK